MGIGRTLRRDGRGSAIVEFALILRLLSMMALGMLTGGIALDRKQDITNSAREAARFGATVAEAQCAPVSECGGLTWRNSSGQSRTTIERGLDGPRRVCGAGVRPRMGSRRGGHRSDHCRRLEPLLRRQQHGHGQTGAGRRHPGRSAPSRLVQHESQSAITSNVALRGDSTVKRHAMSRSRSAKAGRHERGAVIVLFAYC